MRGKKVFYPWNGTQKTITELLKDPSVQSLIDRRTHASQRERLRQLLRNGNITPQIVAEHAARNPMTPQRQTQDTYYGAQRQRRNLPRISPQGSIIINGENLTARQTLERYPQLRGYLQQKGQIKELSLQEKVRKWFRKGKIPDNIINPEPEIVKSRRLLGGTVGQYHIEAQGMTSPMDFLDRVRESW